MTRKPQVRLTSGGGANGDASASDGGATDAIGGANGDASDGANAPLPV
jgi:hypothetical protein